jgi:hypothetical protein
MRQAPLHGTVQRGIATCLGWKPFAAGGPRGLLVVSLPLRLGRRPHASGVT